MAADQVQRLLEDMVPELEDLQKKRLFSKPEVKSIVAKRTAFEYSLLRRMHGSGSGATATTNRSGLGDAATSGKNDFLRYIEFELNIEQLRLKRKARLGMMRRDATRCSTGSPSTTVYRSDVIICVVYGVWCGGGVCN